MLMSNAAAAAAYGSAPETRAPTTDYVERVRKSAASLPPLTLLEDGLYVDDDDLHTPTAAASTRGLPPRHRSVRLVHAWTVWPAKNVFCCFGYCMTGPEEDVGPNTCAWLTMITPMVLFFYVWGTELTETLPPLFTGVAAACFGSSIIFLLITSFTDPGILPRNPDPQVLRQPQPPMYRNRTDEYGNVQTDTWCTTCHIYRPPRATHCQDCDNCVRDFDHHCPFTRNCIGARNYGFFICFLSSLSLSLAVLLCGCMLLGTVAENHGTVLGKPLKEPLEGNRRLINFSLVAFSTFMGMMIWGFTAYHLTLVIGGMTTKEHIKGRKHGAKRLTVMDRCCAIQPSELEPYKLVPDPYDRPPPRVVPVVGYEQL